MKQKMEEKPNHPCHSVYTQITSGGVSIGRRAGELCQSGTEIDFALEKRRDRFNFDLAARDFDCSVRVCFSCHRTTFNI